MIPQFPRYITEIAVVPSIPHFESLFKRCSFTLSTARNMQINEMILSALTGVTTATITWYAARNKNKAETYVSELDAVERAVKVWRELGEEMQLKYESLHDEIELLRVEVKVLREENRQLKEENQGLLQQIKTLTGEKG